MSMIDRSLDGMAFLSGQLGAILQRRLRELGGIALLSLAMIAALLSRIVLSGRFVRRQRVISMRYA